MLCCVLPSRDRLWNHEERGQGDHARVLGQDGRKAKTY